MKEQYLQQLNYLEAMATEKLEDLAKTLLEDARTHRKRGEHLEAVICQNKITLIDTIMTTRAT